MDGEITRQLSNETFDRFLDRQAKSAMLADTLRQLAANGFGGDGDIDDAIDMFKRIYLDPGGRRNDFRHDYSSVSRIMCELANPGGPNSPGGMERQDYFNMSAAQLADCLNFVTFVVMDDGSLEELVKPLQKLTDHVNLEIVRINYISNVTIGQEIPLRDIRSSVDGSRQKVEELYDKVETAQKDVEAASNKATNAEAEIEKSKKDYIAILGILAAVVLAFNGAVTFASSAISATAGHHPFATGFVALMVGFVLFNSIVALFTFLRMMVRESAPWEQWHTYAFLAINAVLVVALAIMFFIIKDAYWL